ncbi:MAG: sensor histidine kinase [Burkholderiaceae bacterium]|jgi:signal transduction histidine kinase
MSAKESVLSYSVGAPATLHRWAAGGARRRVWSITCLYALVSVLWIYFSDQLLALLAVDTETITRWSVYKGWAFVLVTSGLLLWLISRAYGALEKAWFELHTLNETLEQRVAERTLELQQAVTRAESADRLKSAFLATMSHELRTPLNSIIGFTGIVLQGLAGPLTDEQRKQLGMVRNSARHLLDLINDVLDLSKIEAGQLPVKTETFDVAQVIQQAVASVQPMALSKGLTLTATLDPRLGFMDSDRRRVGQIVLNLLNNAIKFTDQGSVTLHAVRLPVDAGPAMLEIAVADTGIGMKEEDMSRLFQPFSQVDSGLTRHYEGSGLGLAICRRLASLLGGIITAQSVWKQGSVFTVRLPVELESS